MQVDVAVVGSGPAGMAAAVEAAEAGASVLLLDEYAKPGGQFFKRSGDGFSVAPARLTREHQRGEALRAKLSHPRIRVLTRALVWGRFGSDLMVYREGRSEAVQASALVIATGAYDRRSRFPAGRFPASSRPAARRRWRRPNGSSPASASCSPGRGLSCCRWRNLCCAPR